MDAAAGAEALDECLDSGTLVGGLATYRFRHELTRLAVERAIPARRRSRLHAVALTGLRAATPDDHARLAHHAEAAGAAAEALHHARLAAADAVTLRSNREAVAQFRRALRFARGSDPAGRAVLHEGLATALALMDHWEESAQERAEALALRRQLGDPVTISENLRGLARCLWRLCRGEECEAAAQESLTVMADQPASEEKAWAHVLYAGLTGETHPRAQALSAAREGLRQAEAADCKKAVAYSLNTIGVLEIGAGRDGFSDIAHSLELALEHHLDDEVGRGYANLYQAAVERCRFAEYARCFTDGMAFCHEHDTATYSACLRGSHATALLRTGRLAETTALVEETLRETISPVNRLHLLISLAAARQLRGDPRADTVLDEAWRLARSIGERGWLLRVAGVAAQAAWLDGRAGALDERVIDVAGSQRDDDDVWLRAELIVWLDRLNLPSRRPASPPVPYALELSGEHEAAARWWHDAGCPFEEAVALTRASRPGHLATAYTVRLTASNAAGSGVKAATVIVAAGVSAPVVLQIPVVLDAFGVPPTHYTSDLVAVNRGPAPTRLSIAFTPAPDMPGAGGPKLGETLAAGGELRIPDVIDRLRRGGYALPPSGPLVVGTLRLTFEDVSDPSLVFAGSRTSTPNPDAAAGGSFGLFAAAVDPGSTQTRSLAVFGLRQDATYRSNLAVEDVPPSRGAGAAAPSSFAVQVVDGETGLPAGSPEVFSLGPGEWRQLGSVLSSTGVRNGWAIVTRTGGGGNGFTAYGVVNDGAASGGGTSDGSYVPPQSASGDSFLPIVLTVSSAGVPYRTELVLANPRSSPVNAALAYVPAAQLGGGTLSTATVALGAGRQLRRDDAIAFLRDELGMALAPGDADQGGTLFVSGAVALARVYSRNPDSAVGGTFGLAFPAVPAAERARTEAWVYGLVQDAGTRSNLAVADARSSGPAVTYLVEIYDTSAPGGPRRTLETPLGPGQWVQFTKILDGSGIAHGYARVRPESGASDFVIYGVLNDGASPGERTSDGSYVAMSGVR